MKWTLQSLTYLPLHNLRGFDALQHLGLRNFNNSPAARLLNAHLLRLTKGVGAYCRRAFAALSLCRTYDFLAPLSARPSHLHPKVSAGGAKHQTTQWFSGSSAKRNGVGLVGDAPGPVAMAMAGLYLVQLFHCNPAVLFQLGEEGRVRTIPTRLRQKVGQHLAPASNKILQLAS